ncbi:3-hydroxyacyl-CoA dehydrogenase family protein [Desulfoscipio gibsoniae]|uniref:3-hydroxybutyryl-CoA dehydrogenase n=1 Tax=Desulfoscipio gibsoniae DSM 7213 TaxID=767817 RepID=R4KK42_9FIRM|nr:3-hydroxyacyl-CoA dehydrogenase family protein [Desulfoscipio gibsoniae]AGL00920.1 3-hydroxyacyl-CoA dehydrogenase [Desulfoscipio gibsoniae DSM 7213]
MAVKTVAVLGAGAMGGGIAQVAAQSGYNVILNDVDIKFVNKAMERIDAFMQKGIEKGKFTPEQKEQVLGRINGTTDMNQFADADLVIEAIIEDLNVKKNAFKELDNICKPETIIATNTSSMSITVLANETQRPAQVVGMHFFNPPPIMRLVEIIRGYYTSDETVAIVADVAKSMRKSTIEVKKDYPGFVVNRLMLVQYLEAIRLVENGVATPEDVDAALKLGLNHPMGQFELQDFAGVDIGYHVLNYLYDEHKEAFWTPPQSLKSLINAGRFGRKTGAGWYDYKK